MMNQYYGYPGYEHAAVWGIGGLLLMILFWIIVVCLIVAVIRRIGGGSRWRHEKWRRWHEMTSNSGLNILNERYAKGEINKEEYDQKKKDLSAE